jgi:type IV pilus assembly protein PilC
MSKAGSAFLKFLRGVPLQEKINFARHLSVATKSGFPLVEALKLIRDQASKKRFKKIIDEIIGDIESGQSLAQSLGRFPHVFNDFFVNLVKVGETSGNLSETLLYLASELKKQREVSHKVRSALVYPVVILVVTIAVTLFLTLFIFPKILPIFVSLGIQLPATTRAVIMVLTFLSNYGFWFLGGLVAFIIGIRLLLMVEKIHFYFDKSLLSMPFISGVVVNVTMTNFSRSLSVLLKSGMNIIDALKVSEKTFHNKYYREQIEQAIQSVQKGESVARYLTEKPKLFPPMVVGMIQVGEQTGNLEQNLLYLSEHYDSEVDEVVRNLTTILEPFLLVFMGLLVGFVALSIITPIYQVTQGLRFQ